MRESISTRTRFEIFKRDAFTCQYCGNKPPAVILHVDHIEPVSIGGPNTTENMITSCQSCNLGKSDVPLTRVVQPLREKLEEELERTEQMAEYNHWLAHIRTAREEDFQVISDALIEASGRDNNTEVIAGEWAKSVRVFLKRMPRELILDAIETAHLRLCFKKKSHATFKYFCGICWRVIGRAEGTE